MNSHRTHRRSLKQWRQEARAALMQRRMTMKPEHRQSCDAAIEALLYAALVDSVATTISLYWPFKGEFDPRSLMRRLAADGFAVALPVVVEPNAPLAFCRWQPGMTMMRGVYGIPVPQVRDAVQPGAVVAPLLGFDRAGYRLGYGGGYYDRTLAALKPEPLIVGAGYECSAIDTIYPARHDVPMHAIVTEAGIQQIPSSAVRALG